MMKFYRPLLLLAIVSFVLTIHLNAQIITTVAGTGVFGSSGDGGPAVNAEFWYPCGVAVDAAGNFYVADNQNNRIRKVDIATGIIHTVVGTGPNGYNGDGILATNAQLNKPIGFTIDAAGNIFIADQWNHRIRKVDASTGLISTIAGTGNPGYSGNNGPATAADINNPNGIALAANGDIYFSEQDNNTVRKIDVATGILTLIAGNNIIGYGGDGGPATAAELHWPQGIAVDNANNVYIADYVNARVRKVDAATGIINTYCGNGVCGATGDGGAPQDAQVCGTYGITIDPAGNIYLADEGNNKIRKIDVATNIITTIAGDGNGTFAGDGGLATLASIYEPSWTAIDASGNIYIADYYNNRIREIQQGCTTVTAGTIINPGADSFCISGYANLHLTGASTGAGISYQWQVSTDGINWSNTGGNLVNYYTGTINTTSFFRNVVSCAASGLKDTTAIDTIHIHNDTIAVVTITANPGVNINLGQVVTFTATILYGSGTPAYQWQKNHLNISGATMNPYITAALAEHDTITCKVADSLCSVPDTVTSNMLVIHIGSAVPNVNNATSLSLYPNPNNGHFHIVDGSYDEGAALEITNILGQVIYKETLPANTPIDKDISLQQPLNSGLYLLKIKCTTGTAVTKFRIEK